MKKPRINSRRSRDRGRRRCVDTRAEPEGTPRFRRHRNTNLWRRHLKADRLVHHGHEPVAGRFYVHPDLRTIAAPPARPTSSSARPQPRQGSRGEAVMCVGSDAGSFGRRSYTSATPRNRSNLARGQLARASAARQPRTTTVSSRRNARASARIIPPRDDALLHLRAAYWTTCPSPSPWRRSCARHPTRSASICSRRARSRRPRLRAPAHRDQEVWGRGWMCQRVRSPPARIGGRPRGYQHEPR